MNLCVSAQGQLFQTQSARDTVREQFSNSLTSPVSTEVRFPDRYMVYLGSAAVKPLFEALMQSTDTKNRIIETVEESRPSTAEVVNATQRVDDATVAIRSQLQELYTALQNGNGFYNRTSFEAQMPWVEPVAARA